LACREILLTLDYCLFDARDRVLTITDGLRISLFLNIGLDICNRSGSECIYITRSVRD